MMRKIFALLLSLHSAVLVHQASILFVQCLNKAASGPQLHQPLFGKTTISSARRVVFFAANAPNSARVKHIAMFLGNHKALNAIKVIARTLTPAPLNDASVK